MKPRPVVDSFFDESGRVKPKASIPFASTSPNPHYTLEVGEISNCYNAFERLAEYQQLSLLPISLGEFEDRRNKILARIVQDPRTAFMVRAPHVPVILLPKDFKDYGSVLEDHYLPALSRACEGTFPGLRFCDFRQREYKQVVARVDATGQFHLSMLLSAPGVKAVVAEVFFSMQGFGAPAAQAHISHLPDNMILASASDLAVAGIMHTDSLFRHSHSIRLLGAADTWNKWHTLSIARNDRSVEFGIKNFAANGSFAAALMVVG